MRPRELAFLFLSAWAAAAAPRATSDVAGLWHGRITISGQEIPLGIEFAAGDGSIQVWFVNGDERVSSTSGRLAAESLVVQFAHYGTKLEAMLQEGQFKGRYGREARSPHTFRAVRGARPTVLTLTLRENGVLQVELSGRGTFTALRPSAARARGLAGPSEPEQHTSIQNPAEPLLFRFKDLDGNEISETDERFAGKVLAEQLQDPTRLRAFIQKHGSGDTVLLGGEPSELQSKLPQAINLNSWPTTFVIGPMVGSEISMGDSPARPTEPCMKKPGPTSLPT